MDEAANIPAKTVNSFKDCIRGTTKTTLIDLCTITPTRSVVTLNARIYSLTKSVLGDDALGNQLTYVRRIPKPRQLSIEDWIRRIREINNLINYFTLPASEVTDNDLVTEIIGPNIPSHYSTKFKMMYHTNDNFQQIT